MPHTIRLPPFSSWLPENPVATEDSFRYNGIKLKEDITMTIRELALNLIEHADDTPATIDLDRAAEIIGWLDPDSDLPEDLTPEAFMDAWNDIIENSPVEDLWHPV